MATPDYTHPKDCPDRREAVANRRTHDTLARSREQSLQLRAHAEWFDTGPVFKPTYDPLASRTLPAPAPLTDETAHHF